MQFLEVKKNVLIVVTLNRVEERGHDERWLDGYVFSGVKVPTRGPVGTAEAASVFVPVCS